MKAGAPTRIYCQTANPAESWHATAMDRISAEMLYQHAIVNGHKPPPMVRTICQLKVDQYDFELPPSQAHH